MSQQSAVEIKCKIDESLHARLVNHLPMYGGIAWAVRTTLENLCDELDNSPSLQDHINTAVRRALSR